MWLQAEHWGRGHFPHTCSSLACSCQPPVSQNSTSASTAWVGGREIDPGLYQQHMGPKVWQQGNEQSNVFSYFSALLPQLLRKIRIFFLQTKSQGWNILYFTGSKQYVPVNWQLTRQTSENNILFFSILIRSNHNDNFFLDGTNQKILLAHKTSCWWDPLKKVIAPYFLWIISLHLFSIQWQEKDDRIWTYLHRPRGMQRCTFSLPSLIFFSVYQKKNNYFYGMLVLAWQVCHFKKKHLNT